MGFVSFVIERSSTVVQRCVFVCIGAKEASARKRERRGCWWAEKEDGKYETCSGVRGDGMGQKETGPLTMKKAVFRNCGLIELPLI